MYLKIVIGEFEIYIGIGGLLELIICVVKIGYKVIIVIIGGWVDWFKLYIKLYYEVVKKFN